MTDHNALDSPPILSERRLGYRDQLVRAEQEMQTAYDRTLLALSSGALGGSMFFLERLVSGEVVKEPLALLVAWLFWGASLIAILGSHFVSTLSMRAYLEALDDAREKAFHASSKRVPLIRGLNFAGGAFFIAGVLLAILFAYHNLPGGIT